MSARYASPAQAAPRNAPVYALTGLVLLALAPTPAPADDVERVLVAEYRIEVLGIPVGKGELAVNLNGDTYSIHARAKTTGIAKLFADGRGDLDATGVFVDGVVRPAAFSQRVTEGSKKSRVDFVFDGNRVDDVVIEPQPRRRSRDKRIPVTEDHKRDVLDPVSALLTAMARMPKGAADGVCSRTFPIFTGEERFDIRLRFKRDDRFRAGGGAFGAAAIVCGLDYSPVAGHKPDNKNVRFHAQNRDNEVWFAQFDDAGLLVPVRWNVRLRKASLIIALSAVEVR